MAMPSLSGLLTLEDPCFITLKAGLTRNLMRGTIVHQSSYDGALAYWASETRASPIFVFFCSPLHFGWGRETEREIEMDIIATLHMRLLDDVCKLVTFIPAQTKEGRIVERVVRVLGPKRCSRFRWGKEVARNEIPSPMGIVVKTKCTSYEWHNQVELPATWIVSGYVQHRGSKLGHKWRVPFPPNFMGHIHGKTSSSSFENDRVKILRAQWFLRILGWIPFLAAT